MSGLLPSTVISESLRGCQALCGIGTTGSGARPGHPLVKPESGEDFGSPDHLVGEKRPANPEVASGRRL